ncbi:MAG: tetratricopeptide repeat protein, partial [Planctomycetes bacterium]|nr:tetratricopeptide repeat protein [Planctomycetota bacterium]
MAIALACACGKKLSAPETSAGKVVKCPACGGELRVPGPEPSTVLDWAKETHGISSPVALSAGTLGSEETEIGGTPERPAGAAGAGRPARLGRYPVLAELGHGGMGEVILVRDPDLNRELAAKVIRGGSVERALVEKFLLEAQVTGQLEHPNIVPVHELGLGDEGRAFFTMKRVQGKDLAAILGELRKESGRVSSSTSGRRRALRPDAPRGPDSSLPRLLGIFLKICDAIAFAHSKGVIHRDLKPANVMVGEFGEVLVMDWGLGKVRGRGESGTGTGTGTGTGETQAGTVMGTPAYMPPEQARGETSKIDERSDIYSLGAILYEMLVLEPPFSGSSAAAVLHKVEEGRLVPPSRRAGGRLVPRELEAAVMKAMASLPEKRYQSVAELKADIEAYLAGRTLQAVEYNPWQVLAKWAKRNKIAVTGGAATAAALLLGVFGIVYVLARGEAEKLLAEKRTREAALLEAANEAETVYRDGEGLWNEADREVEFNPAAPEEFFRRHLAALVRMGQAHVNHPAPPAEWKEALARRTKDLQALAEEAGEWALAQVLAESALAWGAVPASEGEERVARVKSAMDEAENQDKERLQKHLDAIALEEGEKQGKLLPGEIEERAIRLARSTKPSFTKTLLALLAEGKTQGHDRTLLVETLGRKGDPLTDLAGVRAPDLVRQELARGRAEAEARRADPGATDPKAWQARTDETAAWLRAAARMKARNPNTFDDLAELLDLTSQAFGEVGPVAAAASWAKCAGDDPGEVADILAARVRSGSRYTRFLLDLATNGALASRKLAAVFEALGLANDTRPPDPESPDFAAIPVLRESFDRAWEIFADRTQPAAARDSARHVAIAAANALSRLGDGDFARSLYDRRFKAQDALGDAGFMTRTALAFRLLDFSWEEPTTAAAYNNRGLAREHQGDLAGAVADYTRAIELDPNYSRAYGNRGVARRAQGDVAGAVADFTRAIELDPSFAAAYSNRGSARREQGDLAGAVADFTRAIELDPNFALAYDNRGKARYVQGDLAGAVSDYTRATELDPNYAGAYCNRGSARRDQGDLAGAVGDYTRAIELDPNFAMAYSSRGAARRAQGDLAGALADQSKAIELDPNLAAAYNNRGNVRADQGDLAGAVADY